MIIVRKSLINLLILSHSLPHLAFNLITNLNPVAYTKLVNIADVC